MGRQPAGAKPACRGLVAVIPTDLLERLACVLRIKLGD